jgi:RimJ/RimL family protein N-acetyltransferase
LVELQDIQETQSQSPFRIRVARPDDAAIIVDYLDHILLDRMASIADRDEMAIDYWTEREHLRRIEANPLATALIAEAKGEIIGFLTCEGGRRRKIAHVADIGMSVRDDWKRRGVGTALMEYAESWARASGKIRKLTLNVFENNMAAIRLYEKCWFYEEGRLRDQVNLDGAFEDLILMAKLLQS